MNSAIKECSSMKVVLLCGGVGGSKMAEGLYHSSLGDNLSVVGNVADDQEFHGLWVSPDIDTLTYTLADIIDSEKGWGLGNETDNTLNALNRLGCDTWMYLGDQDFATHIYRTQQRTLGIRPTEIASTIAKRLGVKANIVLPTDQVIQNRVRTAQGWQGFQNYFVKNGCREQILEMDLIGIEQAHATAEVLTTIAQADLIIIAPSNPIVSISPILAIAGIKEALQKSSAPVIAVSPIINGKAIRGPADHMMNAAGYSADVIGVAQCYQGVIDGIVIDNADQHLTAQLEQKNLQVMVTNTLMSNRESKIDLANAIVKHMTQVFTLAEVG
jgi:LPPG:FO 2-phospho-L-lactate transferase